MNKRPQIVQLELEDKPDTHQQTEKYINAIENRVLELEKALRDIENIGWGYDGDCGAQKIINNVLDE